MRHTGRFRLVRTTAAAGKWVEGPGSKFFEALRRRLGHLPLIAEDLGLITPGVEALRDEFSLPGMRVLQFGFCRRLGAEKHLPHRFVPHCVVYTGTHDNDTTSGWFTSTDVATTQSWDEIVAERAFARRYMDTDGDELHWDMIRLAFSSVADTAIIPVARHPRARQPCPDEHCLARRTETGRWRFQERAARSASARIDCAELTAVYSRWNGAIPRDLDPRSRLQKLDAVPRRPAIRWRRERSDGPLNVRNQVLVLGMNLIVKNLDDVSDRDDPDELRIAPGRGPWRCGVRSSCP